MTKDISLGIDIGGSHIQSAAVDLSTGEVLKESTVDLKLDRKASAEEIFNRWAEAINLTANKYGSKIKGLGFAMPGPFNYKDGIALFDGENDKYHNLNGLKIKEHLNPLLDLKEVALRFHNDATCFAIGEAIYGQASKFNKSIAITLGTGLGSAFIEKKVPVVSGDSVPDNGSLWHLPFKEGIADDYFSTRWFVNECKKRTGIEVRGVKEVAEMYVESEVVQELFNEFGSMLGEFLSPWIKKFGAEVLIIGGNVSKAFDLFSDPLKYKLSDLGTACEIKTSELMEDAAIVGSAKLIDDHYYEQIKNDLPTK